MKYKGWIIPRDDPHILAMLKEKGGTYQKQLRDYVLSLVPTFNGVIDIGAHIGLWSRDFTRVFTHVHAFEPIKACRKCFEQNVDMSNVTLYECALGHKECKIKMKNTRGHGLAGSYVGGNGKIPMRTLDSFELDDISYIKMDVEGYEYYVLQGGVETIKRNRPIVHLEYKPGNIQVSLLRIKLKRIRRFLEDIGYTQIGKIRDEYVFQHGDTVC